MSALTCHKTTLPATPHEGLLKTQDFSKYNNVLLATVVLPEFQTTHLSSYSNPSNFWVTMPNYFAVNLTSHTWLLQPAFTMVVLPFKVMV